MSVPPAIKLTNVQYVQENISITTPRLNKKNKLTSYILHDGEPFSIRVPTTKAPFGVKEYGNNGEGSNSYNLNVSAIPLKKKDKDKVNNFFDALQELDNMMIKFAIENSEIIFGKGKKYKVGQHEAVIEALYTTTVKINENKDGEPYPRRFQAKIRGVYDEPSRPNVEVYLGSTDNINNKSFTFEKLCELIPNGTFVDMICQPNIWIINKKLGITWNVRQIKINQSKKPVLKSYAFSDHEDSDDDDIGGTASADEASADEASDDEDAEQSKEEDSDEETVVSTA